MALTATKYFAPDPDTGGTRDGGLAAPYRLSDLSFFGGSFTPATYNVLALMVTGNDFTLPATASINVGVTLKACSAAGDWFTDGSRVGIDTNGYYLTVAAFFCRLADLEFLGTPGATADVSLASNHFYAYNIARLVGSATPINANGSTRQNIGLTRIISPNSGTQFRFGGLAAYCYFGGSVTLDSTSYAPTILANSYVDGGLTITNGAVSLHNTVTGAVTSNSERAAVIATLSNLSGDYGFTGTSGVVFGNQAYSPTSGNNMNTQHGNPTIDGTDPNFDSYLTPQDIGATASELLYGSTAGRNLAGALTLPGSGSGGGGGGNPFRGIAISGGR